VVSWYLLVNCATLRDYSCPFISSYVPPQLVFFFSLADCGGLELKIDKTFEDKQKSVSFKLFIMFSSWREKYFSPKQERVSGLNKLLMNLSNVKML